MGDPERQVFIDAIIANPADNTVRLVFADWLQEHGEEDYATYIRWQLKGRFTHPFPRVSYRKWFRPWWDGQTCRRHLMMAGDVPTLLLMKIRENRTGYEDWNQAHVTRGFISHIEIPWRAFLHFAGPIFAQHPIEVVKLRDRSALERPDGSRWFANRGQDDVPIPADSNWLPHRIARLLRKKLGFDGQMRRFYRYEWYYDAVEEANADLLQACLAFGRAEAAKRRESLAVSRVPAKIAEW
jgi:uncharacterized protein (TIGR02996 family)